MRDDEEARRAEAKRLGRELRCGDTAAGGHGSFRIVGDGGQRPAPAAEVDRCRRVAAVRDGDAQTDAGILLAQAGFADGLEELRAIAKEQLRRRDWIPEDVAKAAQGDGGSGDGVPIGGERLVMGRADALQALAAKGDRACIEGVERERFAGQQRRGKIDDELVGLAGVIGVCVQQMLLEGEFDGGRVEKRDALPGQRRGDLQGDARERLGVVVAQRDAGAHV